MQFTLHVYMSYYILIIVIIIAMVLIMMMMMMMMMVVIIIIITIIIIIIIIILTIFSLIFAQVLIVLETKHFVTLVWTEGLSASSLVHSQDLTLQESPTKFWLFKADFPQWLVHVPLFSSLKM